MSTARAGLPHTVINTEPLTDKRNYASVGNTADNTVIEVSLPNLQPNKSLHALYSGRSMTKAQDGLTLKSIRRFLFHPPIQGTCSNTGSVRAL